MCCLLPGNKTFYSILFYTYEGKWAINRTGYSDSCLAQFGPIWRNWFSISLLATIVVIGLWKPYAKLSGANLVVYDVYWLAIMMLFTGLKYLENISNIRVITIITKIGHNWLVNSWIIDRVKNVTEWMPSSNQYRQQNEHKHILGELSLSIRESKESSRD